MEKDSISRDILSELVIHMKYARYLPDKQRRETWVEIVDRNKEMHIKKFPHLKEEIEEAYKYVYEKKVLPSMRSAQFAGKPIEINNARMFNCSYMPMDHPEAFNELMFLLLSGVGVGYSVQKHHVKKLPEIHKPKRTKRYLISDSLMGWAEAIKVLFKAYMFNRAALPVFDYSDIRPAGAPLKTAGGTAPGPEPLKTCIHQIQTILDRKEDGEKLTPLEVHDICCHISDCVLSGGIRRSACISLFSFDDDEMMECKFNHWYEKNPQRGRANNSVVMLRHKAKKEDFDLVFSKMKESGAGEPGIVWSNDKDTSGYNPCLSPFVMLKTKEGNRLLSDIKIGDEIWSAEGWTKVLAKWSSGIKDVYMYSVEGVRGYLYCTKNHRVMSNGVATPIEQCTEIDVFKHNLDPTASEAEIVTLKLNPAEYHSTIEVFDITVDNQSHTFYCNGFNIKNCLEISLRNHGACNLTEINVSDLETQEEFNARAKAASFIGTLQASYTNFHYLREEWKETIEKEALLGVSMTGIASGKVLKLNIKEAAKVVAEENKRVAKLLGINKALRLTCVKPSGCRPEYELVVTNEGVFTLYDMFSNHSIDKSWDIAPPNLTVENEGAVNKVTKTFVNGVTDVFRVIMSYNQAVDCTANHRWFVVGKVKSVKMGGVKYTEGKWVETKDLVKDDIIQSNIGVYTKTTPSTLLPLNTIQELNMKRSTNGNIPAFPVTMTTSLAWFCGYLWGNGAMSPSHYRFRFMSQHKETLEKIQQVFSSVFALPSNINRCTDRNAYTLEVANRLLWLWFHKNGMIKYLSNSIEHIPLIIRTSSQEHIVSFITGLIDSDGCVGSYSRGVGFKEKKTVIVYTTATDEFAKHIQDVAASVGIVFGRSLNCKGKNFQKEKHIWLCTIGYMNKFSKKIFMEMSVKYKMMLRSNPATVWTHDTTSLVCGRVKQVIPIGKLPTYDIEVENSNWFYAGAYKSHNTASLLVGTSSGVHSWHSKYYIRRIRVYKNEPLYVYLSINHPELLEDDFFKPKTQAIISVPVKAPEGAITREESSLDLLGRVKSIQEEWVKPGHVKGHNTNNVSVTVSVKPEEWDEVKEWMWENRDSYAGISILPYDGHTYKQAPFENITEEEYNRLIEPLKKIDLSKVIEIHDNTNLAGEAACSGGACEVT